MLKQLSVIALLVLAVTSIAMADGSNLVSIPESLLTQDQLATIKAQRTITTIGKYAGIGNEIGVAFKEGLGAVKDVAIDLSNSRLGWFVMAMIAWKVVGSDFLQLIIGLPLWLIGTIVFVWSYRKTCTAFKYLKKTERTGLLKWSHEYEVHEPETENLDPTRILHGVFFVIFQIIMAVAVLT